jgi:hypothetical protein
MKAGNSRQKRGKTVLRKLIGKWGSLGTTLTPQLAALAN